MLSDRKRWPQAKSLLDGVGEAALTKSLESCVEPKTLTEQAMNNAAFIVYYEERRYNDLRLEPQAPGLRAEQNGRKNEFMRALADEKAELAFLIEHPEEDSVADLRAYAASASKTLGEFIALVPRPGG